VIDKLNAALRNVLEQPAIKERMAKNGFKPIPSTAAEARARLERELQM
jgi:tripartite-type tricarboxylate transporter receptor subunit TctC